MATTRCFVLAGLLVVGSSAHAAPSHRKFAVDAKVPFHADADTLASAEENAAPEDIADARQRTSPSGWKFAIGRYVGASSIQVGGWAEIASVMTSVTAKAGSLLSASAVSYELIGADATLFSLDARSGVRDQRTTIHGELGAEGFRRKTPELVDAAADVLFGASAALRPTHSLLLAGAFDAGVAGASDSTWPTTLDAGLRVSRTVSLTAGWGSLTTHRLSVITQLRGPRVALQFLF